MKNFKIIEQRLGRAKETLKEIKNFDSYQDFGFESLESHKNYIIIKFQALARQALEDINKIKEK